MNLRELALGLDRAQVLLAQKFLETTPILDSLPFMATNKGLKNVFTRIDTSSVIQKINFNGGLPELDTSFKTEEIGLNLYGGLLKVAQDEAYKYGGADSYFATMLPAILRKTAEAFEKDIVSNILGESQKAGKDNDLGSGAEFIVGINWLDGLNTMLYDNGMFGQGALFQTEMLNGGALHTIGTDSVGNKITGYEMQLKSNFGMQIADSRQISSVSGLTLSSLPTDLDETIDDMINEARLSGAGAIYMSPKLLTKLYKYKNEKLMVLTSNTDLNRVLTSWNGVRIITSHNII